MNFLLSPDDRRAVDIVMDRGLNGASHAWGNRAQGPALDFHRRVQHVSNLMHLLTLMPAPEPADDLVERTLAHVAAAATYRPAPMHIDYTQLDRL
jgi:hypothetical protein